MKKTLAALIIGAFAASAANAAVVYNSEGTKVVVDGSIRLIAEKTNFGGKADSTSDKRHSHSGLRNAGTRFGITVNHDLGDGYYALGRFETRFDGDNKKGAKTTDSFGNLYAKRVYAGIGHKDYGEVKFGKQKTIADDLNTANDYDYGIIEKDDYIPTSGDAVIRYDYNGVEGLTLSTSYQFANSRNDDYEVKVDSLSNAVVVGGIYEANQIIAKLAYGRTNYKVAGNDKHHQNGLLASVGYDFDGFIASVDGGYAKEKIGDTDVKRYFVSPGFQFQVSEKNSIYGNYKYEQEKTDLGLVGAPELKTKTNGFLLGVDYKLHKQVVVFLEGKYLVSKDYSGGKYLDKVKDKAIGVGMHVFF